MFKRILAALLVLLLALGTVAFAADSGTSNKTTSLFKHEHLWSPIPSSDTATCTKAGVKTYKCINIIGTGLKGCTEVKQEASPAKGHTNIRTTTAKATCTTGATETKLCLTCGYKDVQTISAALGHKWGDWTTSGEVECGKGYWMKRTCTVCDKSETQWIQGAHAWGEWNTTKSAKCETAGERTRQCLNCVETQTETIPALGHNFLLNGLETVKPSCTEDGKNVNVCSRCLKSVTTVIPALGHDWGGLADLVATCTQPAFAGKRCERCGLIEYGAEIGKPLGHDYQLTSDTSTCVLPGIQTYTCSHSLLGLCSDPIMVKAVPAKGHKWEGEKVIVEATCTKPGLVGDAVCARCGAEAIGTGTRSTPALGHDWDNGRVVTKATCTTEGEKVYTCKRCPETYSEVIPATGKHNYKLTKVGFLDYRYICTQCGEEWSWE